MDLRLDVYFIGGTMWLTSHRVDDFVQRWVVQRWVVTLNRWALGGAGGRFVLQGKRTASNNTNRSVIS